MHPTNQPTRKPIFFKFIYSNWHFIQAYKLTLFPAFIRLWFGWYTVNFKLGQLLGKILWMYVVYGTMNDRYVDQCYAFTLCLYVDVCRPVWMILHVKHFIGIIHLTNSLSMRYFTLFVVHLIYTQYHPHVVTI